MPRPKKSSYNNEKPPLSYVALCAMAIRSSSIGMMSLNEIYRFIINTFPYYKSTVSKWRNSLRHNLSFNDCFVKIIQGGENGHKRSLWSLHPNCGDMFDDGSLLRRKRRFVARKRHRDETQRHLVKLGTQTANVTLLPTVQKSQDCQTNKSRICNIITNKLSHNHYISQTTILGTKNDTSTHDGEIGSNPTNFSIDNILKGTVSKEKRPLYQDEKHEVPRLLRISGSRHPDELFCAVSKYREHYEHQRRRKLYMNQTCSCKSFIGFEAKEHLFDATLYKYCHPNASAFEDESPLPGIEPHKASLTLHYKACCS